jgi:hypothetical protein
VMNRLAGTTMIWKSNWIQPVRMGPRVMVPFPRRVTIESIKQSAVIPQGK